MIDQNQSLSRIDLDWYWMSFVYVIKKVNFFMFLIKPKVESLDWYSTIFWIWLCCEEGVHEYENFYYKSLRYRGTLVEKFYLD